MKIEKENSLFGNLAKDLIEIHRKEYPGSKLEKQDKENKKFLIIFKRLFKNITDLFKYLDFNDIEFETFEGLFDISTINNVENDLTKLEKYYNNAVFQHLLVSFYPLIRLYYILRLYDQKLILTKGYIKIGILKQDEFENIKAEFENFRNKSELELTINFVKSHSDEYKLLFKFYDYVQENKLYPKFGNRKKINFYNWVANITSYGKKVKPSAIKQQFQILNPSYTKTIKKYTNRK